MGGLFPEVTSSPLISLNYDCFQLFRGLQEIPRKSHPIAKDLQPPIQAICVRSVTRVGREQPHYGEADDDYD